MTEEERFTCTDGGFVLLAPGRQVAEPSYYQTGPSQEDFDVDDGWQPMRFAVTAGQDDVGVTLTSEEAVHLALWLLGQAGKQPRPASLRLVGDEPGF